MTTLMVVLLIGASARLTRLLTTDYLFEPLRFRVWKRLPPRLAYLIRCDWCMSIYVGLAVFVAGWYAPDTPTLIVSGALTASHVTGLSATVELATEGVEGEG